MHIVCIALLQSYLKQKSVARNSKRKNKKNPLRLVQSTNRFALQNNNLFPSIVVVGISLFS